MSEKKQSELRLSSQQRRLVAAVDRYRSWFRAEQRRRRQFQEANANLRQLIAELEEANANLRVERDATDVLLGEAIDRCLRENQR
jgi:hypothetical protein